MGIFITIVGITAGVVTIVAALCKPGSRWWHAGYVLFVCIVIAIATSQAEKIARADDIARAADKLVEERQMKYTHRGFVMAGLAFLEKHKDLYPDTYQRALSLCEDFKCNDPTTGVDMVELSSTMSGILRGLGTLAN